MSRPSFQFYHGDWISNAKLRRCTHEEKGVWIDILCLMADSDEFGIIRWPLVDLAQAVGAKPATIKALVRKDVLKGADEGNICPEYVYVPRSGRKDGDPVTLIPEQPGPIWYSSKQVRDDYVAHARAAYARTQGGATTTPKQAPNDSPKGGIGAGQGDVLPTPSPSPTPFIKTIPTTSGTQAPEPDPIFGICLDFLRGKDVEVRSARSFLGLMRNAYGDGLVFEVVEEARRLDVTKPVPWIRKACETRSSGKSQRYNRPDPRAAAARSIGLGEPSTPSEGAIDGTAQRVG